MHIGELTVDQFDNCSVLYIFNILYLWYALQTVIVSEEKHLSLSSLLSSEDEQSGVVM